MDMLPKDDSFSGVSVIIPTLNEEKGIGSTIIELRRTIRNSQFLVVDGNSGDRTVDIAKKLRADIIKQDGIGKGRAIASALKHVDLKTKYIVFIDADFTYPAHYISEMIQILDKNPRIMMVTGNRFNADHALSSMNFAFYFGNRVIAMMHRLLNGIQLSDPLTGLRVVRREILKGWEPISNGFDIEVELNHYVFNKLGEIIEIPIHYRERLGKKKLSFKHGFTILKRILIQIW